MYKLYKLDNKVIGAYKEENGFRTSFTFNHIDNTDYQEYLKWLAAGNTPEPADEQN